MITATSTIDGPPLTLNASCRGLAIYLDNFAVIRLAKGDTSRGKRFISALSSRADLLFSVANAADLTGPQGKSLEAVRDFLDQLGPHWFPVELDTFEVVQREQRGAIPSESCISKRFVDDDLKTLLGDGSTTSGKVINLSPDFFRLGTVLDWVVPQRDSICEGMQDLDDALIRKINKLRIEFDRNPGWLDQKLPALPFDPSRPATFVQVHLLRALIVEAKQHRLKRGHGLDFSHAVMAGAFASVAMLDKHWKRRLEALPKPNKIARIYYEPELDQRVSDIESYLAIQSDGGVALG
jgi:hypothetical protein